MYRILIEKIEKKPTTKREWQQVANTGNKNDGGPVYDYATFDTTYDATTKVLEQCVDNLDLAAVIKAVNKL